MLVIGPVAATAADRARLSTWQRTACICVCQPLLILAYLLLLLGSAPQGPPPSGAGAVATGAAVDEGLTQWVDAFPASMSGVPPSVPLSLLGISWGVSHALFWGLLPTACPPQSLAIGSGLLGVALNVGPTLFPLALASFVPGPVGPGPGPGDTSRGEPQGSGSSTSPSAGWIAIRALMRLSICSTASCLALLVHSSPRLTEGLHRTSEVLPAD